MYPLLFLVKLPLNSWVHHCSLNGRELLREPLYHEIERIPPRFNINDQCVLGQVWKTNSDAHDLHKHISHTAMNMIIISQHDLICCVSLNVMHIYLVRSCCFSLRTVLAIVDFLIHFTTARALAAQLVTALHWWIFWAARFRVCAKHPILINGSCFIAMFILLALFTVAATTLSLRLNSWRMSLISSATTVPVWASYTALVHRTLPMIFPCFTKWTVTVM